MTMKRGRGRPRGEGIKDGHILEALAVAMLDNPRAKVAPVVRRMIASTTNGRVMGASDLATTRRIQDKWKRSKDTYLEQARVRRAAPRVANRPTGLSARHRGLRAASAIEQALADLASFGRPKRLESTVEKAMREAHESVRTLISGPESDAMRALRKAQESGALRAATELTNNPTARALLEFTQSPTHQALRDFANSPTQRAIREMYDSPTMRAMRLFHGKD